MVRCRLAFSHARLKAPSFALSWKLNSHRHGEHFNAETTWEFSVCRHKPRSLRVLNIRPPKLKEWKISFSSISTAKVMSGESLLLTCISLSSQIFRFILKGSVLEEWKDTYKVKDAMQTIIYKCKTKLEM